jgi:hypothetical protein
VCNVAEPLGSLVTGVAPAKVEAGFPLWQVALDGIIGNGVSAVGFSKGDCSDPSKFVPAGGYVIPVWSL